MSRCKVYYSIAYLIIFVFITIMMFAKYLINLFLLLCRNLFDKNTSKPNTTTEISDENKNLHKLKISPSSSSLSPNQGKIFEVKGFNKLGDEIDPGLINWQAEGGYINNAGKLIVASTAKGIFKVTATSVDNKLSCSVSYTVLPKLTSIKITPSRQTALPGKNVCIKITGIDQTGEVMDINTQPVWNTSIGEIDSTGKLVVNQPNQIAYITARINDLEANAIVSIENHTQGVVLPETHASAPDRNSSYPEQRIYIPSSSNLLCQNNSYSRSDNGFLSSEIRISSGSQAVLDSNYSSPNCEPRIEEDIILIPDANKIKPNRESSKLVALEIDAPNLLFLKPSQERVFTAHGIDQFGKYIDPGKILWRATGGKIDSQGRLIVENDTKGSFRVTAISSNAKISQHRARQNLLLIKISLKTFSWVLSHKKFSKDTLSYFIQEFCDSELVMDKIFPHIDPNNIDGLLTILVFDDIKELIINTAIDAIINYLEEFVVLCFKEKHSSLICFVDYVVLPKLQKPIVQPSDFNIKPRESIDLISIGIDRKGDKIEIEQKVNWKATGGSIDRKGKLTVNSKSQGSYKVRAIVGNSLNVSVNYSVLPKSSDLATSHQLANPDSKQRDLESKSSWSAKGGEIYSADLGSTSTSPQLANPDSKQQDTESKAFWSAKGGKIYSADLGSFPTFILYLPKRTSN